MKTVIPKNSIFIAEGENHVRRALRPMLDNQKRLEVIGVPRTPEGLITQVSRQSPDLILLDWGVTGLHPYRMMTVLKNCCLEVVLVITSTRFELQIFQ